MDRQLIYPGQIPLETDLLNTNKNTMIALAKIAAAILGTTTQANGLSVVPTSPTSLQVLVNPGEIYSLQNIDSTAYSSIAADTTHQIFKQGISLDQVTLSCPAPGVAGQSINYLIEAAYQDTDALPVVLPYYNASNPSTAYSGPNNAGTTNNTVRQGRISLVAKAGTAATTGTQTTPAADSGYTGLYVVTVANGQTQITSGNITTATSAPLLSPAAQLNLANVFTQIQSAVTPSQFDNSTKLATTAFVQRALGSCSGLTQVSSGTTVLTAANLGQVIQCTGTATVTLPSVAATPAGSSIILFTSGSTLTINRAGSDVILSPSGSVTSVVISTGSLVLTSQGASGNWLVTSGPTPALRTTQKFTSGSGTYTTPALVRQILVRMVGGGGGGAGGGTSPGSGGTGGTTTFNSINANGGNGGAFSGGGSGGTGGTGTATFRTAGCGGSCGATTSSSLTAGGTGGCSLLGGGAIGGSSAVANTGGGGGGGSSTGASGPTGGAGGAGEYVELFINSPAATYSYAVGAAGTVGTAGTGGAAGGAGGAGVVYVIEFY